MFSAFLSRSRGLKLVPSKWRCLAPPIGGERELLGNFARFRVFDLDHTAGMGPTPLPRRTRPQADADFLRIFEFYNVGLLSRDNLYLFPITMATHKSIA